jgi:hypothetical protein
LHADVLRLLPRLSAGAWLPFWPGGQALPAGRGVSERPVPPGGGVALGHFALAHGGAVPGRFVLLHGENAPACFALPGGGGVPVRFALVRDGAAPECSVPLRGGAVPGRSALVRGAGVPESPALPDGGGAPERFVPLRGGSAAPGRFVRGAGKRDSARLSAGGAFRRFPGYPVLYP